MTSARAFTIMLAMTPGVGGKSLTRILARNQLLSRSPAEFLGLAPEALSEEYRLSPKAIHWLVQGRSELLAETGQLEKRLGELGVKLVTAIDPHYPAMIEQFDPDPPGVLFLYGNQALLEKSTFCVLSSRNSFPADLELIEKLTEEGVLNGEVLVTGHDTPEYQRSAVVPLRWGSPRILCLDRGLFKVLGDDLRDEAFRAARLWRYEFDPTTDLAISQFRPSADYAPDSNRKRDRLVAALSRRLDFVQVTEGGNMQRLLRMAVKASRSVRVSDRTLNYRSLQNEGASVIA